MEVCSVLTKISSSQTEPVTNIDPSSSLKPQEDFASSEEDTTHTSITTSTSAPPDMPRHTMVTRARSGITKPNKKYLMQVSTGSAIPTRVKVAIADLVWLEAMKAELNALEKNDTWLLVERNNAMNVLSSKWVYKHKLDE